MSDADPRDDVARLIAQLAELREAHAKRTYWHYPLCNGSSHYPVGEPGMICNCKSWAEHGVFAKIEARRDDGHAACREVEQKLRDANRRLQAQGPALERDKLIIQLRERIAELEGHRCVPRDWPHAREDF